MDAFVVAKRSIGNPNLRKTDKNWKKLPLIQKHQERIWPFLSKKIKKLGKNVHLRQYLVPYSWKYCSEKKKIESSGVKKAKIHFVPICPNEKTKNCRKVPNFNRMHVTFTLLDWQLKICFSDEGAKILVKNAQWTTSAYKCLSMKTHFCETRKNKHTFWHHIDCIWKREIKSGHKRWHFKTSARTWKYYWFLSAFFCNKKA